MIFGRSFQRHLVFHIDGVRIARYSDSRVRLFEFELCIPVPTHCRNKPEFDHLVILIESGVASGSEDARQCG